MKLGHSLCLLLLCIGSSVFANDSEFSISGSGIVPIDQNQSPISLRSENLQFSFFDHYYEVRIDYLFYNAGDGLQTKLGFPIKVSSVNIDLGGVDNYISNFKTSVNEEAAPFDRVVQNATSSTTRVPPVRRSGSEYWYIKDVQFAGNAETRISVEYRSRYSRSAEGNAEYYYGSGNSWKNGIEKLTIRFKTCEKKMLTSFDAPFYNSLTSRSWIDKETLQFEVTNLQPQTDDTIRMSLAGLVDLDYGDFFQGNQRAAERVDLSLLTREQLRLLRNGFYAFAGYRFKSPDLQEIFKAQLLGYEPRYDDVDGKLDSGQKKMIESIRQEELTR